MFTPEEFAIMHINDLERHKFVLTSDGKIAIRVLGGAGGDMLKTENLSGLTDYAIARSNLEVYSSDEIDTLLTGYALTGHNHDGVYSLVGHTHAGVYEPVFSKNTGFNKNFGTAAGTVLEGNRDALYEKLANKGQANGYAPLDSGSLIPSMYLPSYVDDVIDVALYANLPGTGESGKVYNVYGDTVSLNGSYRWGGAAYSKISSVSDAVWGHITGTLTDQADLVSALAGKAAALHTHVLTDLPAISQNHFLGRNSSGSGAIEVLSAAQTRSALSVYSISDVDGFTVKLSGNQTITGIKTFSSAPVVPDSSFAIAKIAGLQTALDGKLNLSGGTMTGKLDVQGNYIEISNIIPSLGGIDLGWYQEVFSSNGTFALNKSVNGGYIANALAITEDMNVGIGTTTPTEKLDVHGNISFSEPGSTRMNLSAYGFGYAGVGPFGDWGSFCLYRPGTTQMLGFAVNNVLKTAQIYTYLNAKFEKPLTFSEDGVVTIKSINVEKCIDITGTDLNTVLLGGQYNSNTTIALNGPINEWIFLEVLVSSLSNNWIMQRATLLGGTSSTRQWLRKRDGGTWYGWKEVTMV